MREHLGNVTIIHRPHKWQPASHFFDFFFPPLDTCPGIMRNKILKSFLIDEMPHSGGLSLGFRPECVTHPLLTSVVQAFDFVRLNR